MSEYRDYGALNQSGAQNVSIEPARSQVYIATHKGEEYLPFMYRSFISFSFGGKNIEDFGLIAVSDGNSYQMNGYADFEDITSKYDILDGHYYWGTHYTDHKISFKLITDGMTETQMQDFFHWFSPGKIRELILAEHPNRAIMARIESAPQLAVIPFEQSTVKKISRVNYNTKTTLYKGTISLTFITEEPHWYSKINIFGYLDSNQIYRDVWTDANGRTINIYDDPDAVKIILEDNIPTSSMIKASMLLGDNKFANISGGAQTAPQYSYTSIEISTNWPPLGSDNFIIAGLDDNGNWKGARIAGAKITEAEGISELSSNTKQYFYYAGTAPSYRILEFTLTPEIDDSTGYIINPRNSFSDPSEPYNTITIESTNKRKLKFTTPSLYTAYNQAIQIFRSAKVGNAWSEIRENIRDYVKHPAVRAWANHIIYIISTNEQFTRPNFLDNSISAMKRFLTSDNVTLLPATFTINNKTGQIIAKLQYREPSDEIVIKEEDVGDMIYFNDLIIEDRNYPTENGEITGWSNNQKTNSYYLSHDVTNGLKDVKLTYKNMYL